MTNYREYEDRHERRHKAFTDKVATWLAVAAFLLQLGLGAIAYGRLDGRVSSIETEVHMLLERSLSRQP